MSSNKQNHSETQNNPLDCYVCDIDTGKMSTKALVKALNDACDAVEDNQSSSVLYLRLSHIGIHQNEQLDVYDFSKWEKVLRRIEQLRLPVVCSVKDKVYGLGLALILVTDKRFVSNDCSFTLCNEQQQIIPGAVIQRLTQQLGAAHTRQMALWGNSLSADSALTHALVDDVADDCEYKARAFIDSLTVLKVRDLAVRRQLVQEAFAATYEQGLGSHLAACDRLLRQDPDLMTGA